ncbi:hypothetical protein [Paraflavitalea speifideaquila]|uniref:hypothetical protein n=1 Tax=Paraflavitalea speifideaquila TaxID=3076558 RepID=UPI0028EFD3AB|nr:hypothetical protein [Paraflavitalea speifideiaquila]
MFIIYGLVWLVFLYGILASQSWAYKLGLFISILSLWYLPVGTVLLTAAFVVLIIAKGKLGL